ncbi:hypothetical protein V8F33_012381 [Rhypophila sp. PSN 637]
MENLNIYNRVPFNITWEGVPDMKYCLLVWTDADDPSGAYGILKSSTTSPTSLTLSTTSATNLTSPTTSTRPTTTAKDNNPSTTTLTASILSPPPVPSPNDPAMTVPIGIVGAACVLMAIFAIFRLFRRRQKRKKEPRGKQLAIDGHGTTMANKHDDLPELAGERERAELDNSKDTTDMAKVTEMEGCLPNAIPCELESNAQGSKMSAMGQINELERTGHPSHLEAGSTPMGEGLDQGGGQAMQLFPYKQPVYLVHGYDGTYQGYHYSSQIPPPDAYPSHGEPQAWMHQSDMS